MPFDRRHTAAAIVGVLGIAGAFVLVPDPPPVLTVSTPAGGAAYTSIQEAVDALGPRGGTVEVQEGTYAERVVLDDRRGVSLRARTGDRVVLDASGLTPTEGLSGVIEVRDGSLIDVDGLELKGYRTSSESGVEGAVPVGLLVTGSVEGLSVENLTVHGIGAVSPQTSTREGDGEAYGVAVLGDDANGTSTEVLITGTEMHDLTLGSGGAILVDGNVRDWEVTGNQVHDVDGTGIVVTSRGTTLDGAQSGEPTYRPRDGIISGNSIFDVSAATNPAYGPDGCLCAAGISIDGALDVTLSDNTVERTDVGIEVGAREPEGATEGIDAVENTVQDSRSAALTVGHVTGTEQGHVTRVLVRGNLLRGAPAEAIALLGAHLSNVRFSSNELVVTEPGPVLLDLAARGPVLDHNSYVAAEPILRFGEREVTELRDWQLLTRQDSVSSVRTP